MRTRIPILERRAKEAAVDSIRSRADIVPLLLSHTTYKTYPQNFVIKRQWDKLLKWLSVISTENFDDVDMTGCQDIDDFLKRLWDAGYTVTTSSGTGGKVSMLPKNQRDINFYRDYLRRFRGIWPNNATAGQDRHFFGFGPISGPTTSAFSAGFFMEDFGRPDSRHVLIEEPLSIAKVTFMAEMREKLKSGTATPDEIRKMEEEGSKQADVSSKKFDEMVELLAKLRHEPIFMQAFPAQAYEVVQRLRAMGVPDGDFHPESIIGYGGGVKHFKLPDGWEAELKAFFGKVIYSKGYGMTEMNWLNPQCAAGHYHISPIIIPLVLNQEGSELAVPDENGIVEGRMALLDLSTQIRWGGTISGDKVVVDIKGNCPCGHKGPNVHSIGRYIDLEGDDKIQCSGMIDAYIRGTFVQ
jgi:hypothetical protein